MTKGISYIMLPAMLHSSKYMWLMFYFLLHFYYLLFIFIFYYGHIPEKDGWGTNSGTSTTVWKTMLQTIFLKINPLHTQWPTHRMSQLSITQQQNLITTKSTSTFCNNYCISWIPRKWHFLDHILSNMNPVHNLNH